MLTIKFIRDHGHYHAGDEVRLEPDRAKPFVNGGYAVNISDVKSKQLPPPENKMAEPENESTVKKIVKKIKNRKKASNEE